MDRKIWRDRREDTERDMRERKRMREGRVWTEREREKKTEREKIHG